MSNQEHDAGAAHLGLAELIRRLSDGSGTAGGSRQSAGPESPGSGAGGPDVLRFVGLAASACLASSLRSWSRAAELLATELPSFARAIAQASDAPPLTPEARALLLEEFRGRLRALTEIPLQESRALQAELESIVAAIWPAARSTAHDPYWRRWEAKP